MNLARKGELALVDSIRARFASRLPGGGKGIGDDAAVIAPGPGKLLASVDIMQENVHFDLSLITPCQLGFKLAAVNASDIYAMGGRPEYMLLSMSLPADTEVSFLESFFDGFEDGMMSHGVVLAGGDLSSSRSGLSLSATILGRSPAPVMRSGARVGDGIFVTGTLGDSACGLELLRRIGRPVDLKKGMQRPLNWDIMSPLLRRHLMPEPVPLSKGTLSRVSSMMDLSDGLLLDLWRLCRESGKGAVLEESAIPVSPEMRKVSALLGLDPLDTALTGGEDYLLLFTGSMKSVRGAVRIGSVVRSGLKIVSDSGVSRDLTPRGYGHFGGEQG